MNIRGGRASTLIKNIHHLPLTAAQVAGRQFFIHGDVLQKQHLLQM
jgi:hypothetical protein